MITLHITLEKTDAGWKACCEDQYVKICGHGKTAKEAMSRLVDALPKDCRWET